MATYINETTLTFKIVYEWKGSKVEVTLTGPDRYTVQLEAERRSRELAKMPKSALATIEYMRPAS